MQSAKVLETNGTTELGKWGRGHRGEDAGCAGSPPGTQAHSEAVDRDGENESSSSC